MNNTNLRNPSDFYPFMPYLFLFDASGRAHQMNVSAWGQSAFGLNTTYQDIATLLVDIHITQRVPQFTVRNTLCFVGFGVYKNLPMFFLSTGDNNIYPLLGDIVVGQSDRGKAVYKDSMFIQSIQNSSFWDRWRASRSSLLTSLLVYGLSRATLFADCKNQQYRKVQGPFMLLNPSCFTLVSAVPPLLLKTDRQAHISPDLCTLHKTVYLQLREGLLSGKNVSVFPDNNKLQIKGYINKSTFSYADYALYQLTELPDITVLNKLVGAMAINGKTGLVSIGTGASVSMSSTYDALSKSLTIKLSCNKQGE